MQTERKDGLTDAERKELQDFRREAEIQTVREEVMSSLAGRDNGSGHKRKKEEKVLPLTPKTLRAVRAEAVISGSDGSIKPMLSQDAATWEQVSTELQGHALPDVKKLLVRLRGEGGPPTPRGRADVVNEVLAELQCRTVA